MNLGHEDIEVTGESYYSDGIARMFIAAGRPLGGLIMRTAVLVADPDNPHDRFAVRVYVEGQQVGWIPQELAPDVQPVVSAVTGSGRQMTTPVRVWSCFEDGEWSARVTVMLSGAAEPEWSYTDADEGSGDPSPAGTRALPKKQRELRQNELQRRFRQFEAAEAAGLIRGVHFKALRSVVAQKKTSGDVAGALSLLMECIDAAERSAGVYGTGPVVWPTEQAAILLRREKNYHGEIAVLERLMVADPVGLGTKPLRRRLARARSLIGDTTPVPEPTPVSDPRLTAPPRLDVSQGDLVTVTLPVAVELSYEQEHMAAITEVFAEAGAPIGTALETSAVLHEFYPPGKAYSLVAVYVGGRLIGYVNNPLYRDHVFKVLHTLDVVNKNAVVRCRIYAAVTPKWIVRATLGPYESVVAGPEETQYAAELRAEQAVSARL